MNKIFALFLITLLFSACNDVDSSSQEKNDNRLEKSKNTNDQSNRINVSNIIGEWEGVTSSSPGSPPLFTIDIKYAKKGVVDAQYWIQYLGDQNPTKHNITGTYKKVGDTIKIVFDYSLKADQNNFKFTGSIIDKRTIMFCIYESEYDYIYWDFEIWKKEKKESLNHVLTDQLPILKAECGEGQNIDWNEIEKNYNSYLETNENYGPDYFDNDCSQGVNVIKVSSTLPSQGMANYNKNQLTDSDPKTAWVEGKDDYGIGEFFICKGFCPNVIYNGYQNSPKNWKNNSRVKRFRIYINDKPYAFLDLSDEMGAQHFDGPHGQYEGNDEFKFEIVDVYPGDKWSDVAISHVDYVACCFSMDTQIFGEQNTTDEINIGDKIYTIDLNTEQISEASIQKISLAKHVNMLKLKTQNHNITITKNHPLYFEGMGFISIQEIMQKMSVNSIDEINELPRVLTFNKHTGQIIYEKIDEIKSVNELMQTFTIRKISNNSNYVANGFICKTY